MEKNRAQAVSGRVATSVAMAGLMPNSSTPKMYTIQPTAPVRPAAR